MTFPEIALEVPRLLLPAPGVDLSKWAVIACDQYTSQPAYWQKARDLVGDAPSTLKMIFPEVYLEEPDDEARIAAINAAMRQALDDGTLLEQPPGFLLLDRKTGHVPSRKGLVVALDLDQYDFTPASTSMIRATEGTILDRLPPRIKVREKAPLELPHIMVLIDDPERTVIEPLFDEALEPAYDFELMLGGGHLKGWRVERPELIGQVAGALKALADPQAYRAKYRVESDNVVLYAMGDGNHSFATAKAIWEKLKSEAADPQAIMQHPARHALVELVNLHDPGLEFEAIYRVLFGVDPQALRQRMVAYYQREGGRCRWRELGDETALRAELNKPVSDELHRLPMLLAGSFGVLEVENPRFSLPVATLQDFLDQELTHHGGKIDYIHGLDVVTELAAQPQTVGFYLPAISKFGLFRSIILDGALPRKTFSMGEADEKRFYLEGASPRTPSGRRWSVRRAPR